jgi:hypothetical protein
MMNASIILTKIVVIKARPTPTVCAIASNGKVRRTKIGLPQIVFQPHLIDLGGLMSSCSFSHSLETRFMVACKGTSRWI